MGIGRGVQRMWASYTGIPVGSRAVMFMLSESTFTRHLEGFIDDVNYEHAVQNVSETDLEFLHSIVHLDDTLNKEDTIIWDLERRGAHIGVGGVKEIPFHLFGPYHSNNNDVNNHSKCLVVSSGIGSTVRDAIIAYQLQKRGAWDRLVCLHLAGRKPVENPDISRYSELHQILRKEPKPGTLVEHISIHCSTNFRFWHKVILSAIPADPLGPIERVGKSEIELQEAADQKRFVVIVCGKKAAEMIQDAIQYHDVDNVRLSETQLQYIDIEEFK